MHTNKQLKEKLDILLEINALREKIQTYKYIHVLSNDKFSRSIVDFINTHFTPSEHCFVFIGSFSGYSFPLPAGDNVFNGICPESLAISDNVSKIIFHGLFKHDVIKFLYNNLYLLKKGYWIPWGGDLYEEDVLPYGKIVKSSFQGGLANKYAQKIYEQKYGKGKVFFPFNICFSSIKYEDIISVKIPAKSYLQIMVNNSSHKSTIEVFENLERFKNENILVVTILSYGQDCWKDKILAVGKEIFHEKFLPINNYLPPKDYIKFLARNDIYIMNQHRPQGMTTAFTAMLMGQKIFMRGELSGYLQDEGYILYDTNSIPQLSFEEFCSIDVKTREHNKYLAASRYDEAYIKECWQKLFDYTPDK